MAYPHNYNTYSSNWYILHADKADCHDYCHHSDNLAFCCHCHGSFLNKTVQMFLIKIRSYEPVVQFLRTLCKVQFLSYQVPDKEIQARSILLLKDFSSSYTANTNFLPSTLVTIFCQIGYFQCPLDHTLIFGTVSLHHFLMSGSSECHQILNSDIV